MADIYNKRKRSKIMSAIRSKDTKPEVKIRKALYKSGFRYRKNVSKLPGSPDIVLWKYMVVIQIHGCFWHGHDCKAGKLPKTNVEFWKTKIERNVNRDLENEEKLSELGYKVINVFTCEISTGPKFKLKVNDLINKIKNNATNT